MAAIAGLGGCGTETQSPALRVAIPYSDNVQDPEQNYYLGWLKEKTGLNLEIITIRQNRSVEYLDTLFSSGADVDVVLFGGDFTITEEELKPFVEAGAIWSPFEERSYYPNYGSTAGDNAGQILWINYDWLLALNLSVPRTTKELEEVLLAFKNNDPNQNGIQDEIPLFEFDTEPTAIIEPLHDNLQLTLPARCVFGFLGDYVDAFAKAEDCPVLGVFETTTKNFPVYGLEKDGKSLCFCQGPLGAPAAVQFMDWLIGHGVQEIVATGCCGTLVGFPENVFLIPTRALRDEGTSYHYVPAARSIDLNGIAVSALAATLERRGVPYTECFTWTTDGFFRETKEKAAARKSEGCSVVEMECAALAACAQFRKVLFAELLFTGDTLADPEKYAERGWGKDSHAAAFSLAVDSVIAMC